MTYSRMLSASQQIECAMRDLAWAIQRSQQGYHDSVPEAIESAQIRLRNANSLVLLAMNEQEENFMALPQNRVDG